MATDRKIHLMIMQKPLIAVLMISFIGFLGGCSVDEIEKGAASLEEKAEELKQTVESSNLKDCKDDKGNPLPEWICRKDEPSAKE